MSISNRSRNTVLALGTLAVAAIGLFGLSPSSRASNTVRLTETSKSIFTPSNRLLAAADKISPKVFAELAESEMAPVVILMADQADVSAAYEISDQDARGWFVYNTLSEHAERTQASLKSYLSTNGIRYQSFWAANMIVADLNRDIAVGIAGRSDVARLDSNRSARWIESPEIAQSGVVRPPANAPAAVEWGVSNVNAPAVWALGFNGNGIVVGGLDTGIRWTHSAIRAKYRGWDGTTANHNYNWHDSIHTGGGICGPNTTAPCDDSGHGSHTLGTMVGDDGAGNQVGVAPGARWVGCRNMDIGNGTPATYTECFQFMIAPTDSAGNAPNPTLRPHVLNNSWGCPPVEGCTTGAELEMIVNNTQAAGIFVQASAGNSGQSGCSTVSTALAIYDASFSAGATDISNALANFSSRGPSTFYNPNLLKPNISAPGSNVRSLSRTSDTSFGNSSGTSMASPHVAGVVALLWSARPGLVRNIAATKTLLQNTANPLVTVAAQTCGGTPSTVVPNNIFGYGRVDALAAINATAAPAVTVSGRVLTSEGAGLRNAIVAMIDSNGIRRTAPTSSFGNFSFDNVRASETYTITVASKRYRFAVVIANVMASNLLVGDLIGLQ